MDLFLHCALICYLSFLWNNIIVKWLENTYAHQQIILTIKDNLFQIKYQSEYKVTNIMNLTCTTESIIVFSNFHDTTNGNKIGYIILNNLACTFLNFFRLNLFHTRNGHQSIFILITQELEKMYFFKMTCSK